MKRMLLSFVMLLMVGSLVFTAVAGSNGQSKQMVSVSVNGQVDGKIVNTSATATGSVNESGSVAPPVSSTSARVDTRHNTSGKSAVSIAVHKGKSLKIYRTAHGIMRMGYGNITVKTSLNLTFKKENNTNEFRPQVKLNNGKNAEIKVMPDTASKRALERLKVKMCSAENNCSIELKEVGKTNQTKLAYDVHIKKHVKFLGLFKMKMNVEAQVDAENGNVIQTKRPWWSFLTTDSD